MIMNKLMKLALVSGITLSLVGCASLDRFGTDVKSDFSGGLNRVINVYTADGKLLRTFEGKIDIAANDGGYVKFDYKGKRYVYYNCFIETIAEK